MSRAPFVVDSSPWIFLTQIQALPLLKQLASEVLVPASVVDEVRAGGPVLGMEVASWMRVVPKSPLPEMVGAWDLGAGESHVIAVAAANPGSVAVIDDGQGRRCARLLGITTTGTLGVIIRLKRAGLISAARPLVEELLRGRIYLRRDLVEAALAEVGE